MEGKIKGDGTIVRREVSLHGGWHSTKHVTLRAVIYLKTADRLQRRRAAHVELCWIAMEDDP